MGAKFWTSDEKQVFLDVILPRSRYALPDNDSGERLDWEELVPIMQKVMDRKGGDRVYTKTSLFQHYYQKVGSRAQQRGEADTMTISKHQRYRTRNGKKRNCQNLDDEYEDDEDGSEDSPGRTPSPDLPPFPQSLTRDTSGCVSKAGRPALFVEDSDDEIKVEGNSPSQSQSRHTARSDTASNAAPKPDDTAGASKGKHVERQLQGGDDFMDDVNDIPGQAEDEAWEAAQLQKRKGKKQAKEPSKKRDHRSQNSTTNDETDVDFVPRKRQILPKNVHPRGHSDDDEALAQATGSRFVDIQSKDPRPKGRQPNKATPVRKARFEERNEVIMVDSDDEDDSSPYQSRDRYGFSSGYYAIQGARSRHDDPRQAREQRTEQSYHYSNRDRDQGRYGEGPPSMYRQGISASAFDLPPERAEQRPRDRQASSTSTYGPTPRSYRGPMEFNGGYPSMGEFRLPSGGRSYLPSSSEHANPYANMGRTPEQGGFAADQRFSYSDRAQGYANHAPSSSTSSRRRYPGPPGTSANLPLPPRSSQASAPSRSLAPTQPSIRRAQSAASSTVRSEPASPRVSHNAGPDPTTPRNSHLAPGPRGSGPARAESNAPVCDCPLSRLQR